jgi:hypothetical protein
MTTCAASSGGLPADGRNFSFPLKRATKARDSGHHEE